MQWKNEPNSYSLQIGNATKNILPKSKNIIYLFIYLFIYNILHFTTGDDHCDFIVD
jgi:hypothetical protein